MKTISVVMRNISSCKIFVLAFLFSSTGQQHPPDGRLIITITILMRKLQKPEWVLTLSDLLNPFMNPALVSNETVPAPPAHLISIYSAITRLLLIGLEIFMRDIHGGHYRFFILLFGLQMKRGIGARRLSLMKERSQISS